MKRMIGIFLALAMLLSLTACGEKAETMAVTESVTETIAPVTEPTTEPALSHEEQLLSSLPERTRQAYEVGLVSLDQLEDLERTVTIGEAAQMLQRAYVHRTGVESKTLKELIETPAYADRTADRGWIFGVPGQVDMELTYGEHYENYQQWLSFLNDWDSVHNLSDLWWSFAQRLGIAAYGYSEDGEYCLRNSPTALDGDEFGMAMGTGTVYGPDDPTVYSSIHEYAFRVYDQTTGKKFFALEDGYLHYTKALTVADAAEYALTFYHYPNPMACPELIAPEDVGTFNTDIITQELLEKETGLPAVSNQSLPQWHGVVMNDMTYWERCMHLDDQIYEYEIRAIKEAGFNYIGLRLDFNWMTESILSDPQKEAYVDILNSEDFGCFSLEHLEELDQVIAWCMKYDIHVNLRGFGIGGYNDDTHIDEFNDIRTKQGAERLAQNWRAIARRYADIPNVYLSFTPFTTPKGGCYPTQETILPSVEAMLEESPDRCIIVDVFGWAMEKSDAEAFAKMGVALSCRIGGGDGKSFDWLNHTSIWKTDEVLKESGKSQILDFTWPYQGQDAAAVLAQSGFYEVDVVWNVAQEYGVGFMVSDFGITRSTYSGYTASESCPRYRYSNEAYQTMLLDFINTFQERGYGWCFGNWYGYFGVANPLPVLPDGSYTQVGDNNYYLDNTMLNWFQQLNNVA